jgi:hypothetical protein
MVFSPLAILKKLRVELETRREAELRTFVANIIADCSDGERQAERLARWERRLNQCNGAAPLSTAAIQPERI